MRSKLLHKLAADYEAMFETLYRLNDQIAGEAEPHEVYDSPKDFREKVKAQTAWAKQTFKKSEWVVWWLRWFRLGLLNEMEARSEERLRDWGEDKAVEQKRVRQNATAQQMLAKEMTAYGAKAGEPLDRKEILVPYWMDNHQAQFEHFMATPAPEIEQYRPGYKTIRQVLTELHVIEKKWQETRKRIQKPKDGDKIVLDCGGGLGWWFLDRSMCEAEGDAMGHCGNAASKDPEERLLSLRSDRGRGDFEAHATFILGPSGFLGEMKGRSNTKPAAKYHPAIIKLLESNLVKGILGGGHAPEENFSVADLTDEQREALYRVKPDMMPIEDYVGQFGINDKVHEKVSALFRAPATWDEKEKEFRIACGTLDELVTRHGNHDARECMQMIRNAGQGLYSTGLDRDVEAGLFLGKMPHWELETIGNLFRDRYPEEIAEWFEEDDSREPYFEEAGSLDKFANHAEDRTAIKAMAAGYAAGEEAAGIWARKAALKGACAAGHYFPDDIENEWQGTWSERASLDRVRRLLDEGIRPNETFLAQDGVTRKLGVTIRVDEPYDGFRGRFDVDAAIEKFDELYQRGGEEPVTQERVASLRAKLLQKNAADYGAMFHSIWPAVEATHAGDPDNTTWSVEDIKAMVTEEIAWATKVFKKADKITWWLRWFKLALEDTYLPEEQSQKSMAAAAAKSGAPFASIRAYLPSSDNFGRWHKEMEHWMSLPIEGIQQYQPGWKTFTTVYDDLRALEDKWKASRKDLLQPKDGDKPVLNFPDGWAWWLLDGRPMCEEEGDAMGHCGNAGYKDDEERILSLRQTRDKGYQRPSATFILLPDGTLGEMKGRANLKPKAIYHPYIIALLKSDLVKGITGGGHAPEQNFSMMDLPEQTRQELYKLKPQLKTLRDYYTENGADEHFIKTVEGHISPITWDQASEDFFVPTFKNVRDLLRNMGNDGAYHALKLINAGIEPPDDGSDRVESARSVLGDLPRNEIEKIGRILVHEHQDQVAEWLEEEGYDPEDTEFDTTDVNDIVRFAAYVGDEVYSALVQAASDGLQWGTEKKLFDTIKDAVQNSVFYPEDPAPGAFWDTRWGLRLSPTKACDLIEKGGEEPAKEMFDSIMEDDDNRILISDDHDYTRYDEEQAAESFQENYPVDKEYEAAFGEGAVTRFHEEKHGERERRSASIPSTMKSTLLQKLAVDYEAMFAPLNQLVDSFLRDPLPKEDPDYFTGMKVHAAQEIVWAKQALKKSEWIIWWLRWYRLAAFTEIAEILERRAGEPYGADEIRKKRNERAWAAVELRDKEIRAYAAKANMGIDRSSVPRVHDFNHRQIEHLVSIPAEGIQQYRPGYKSRDTVVSELEAIERKWQDERKHIVQPEQGDEIVLDLGGGLAWWLLDRNSCEKEGDAMGHCGNTGSTDPEERILSLRKKKGGALDWEPHATFILHPGGILGEMKGKENDKPSPKYHPAIVALLQTPMIQEIKGGGYLPEKNFDVADLAPELREDLYKVKPQLMTAPDYLRRVGVDDILAKKIVQYFNNEDYIEPVKWDPKLKQFITGEWESLASLVGEKGNKLARWAIEVLDGDHFVESDADYDEECRLMLETLPDDQMEMIGRMLVHEYPDQLKEWRPAGREEEEHDEDEDEDQAPPQQPALDVTDAEDIVSFARFVEDQSLTDALSNGYQYGYRAGHERELEAALRQAVAASAFVPKAQDRYESKFYEVRTPEFLCGVIEKNQTLEEATANGNDLQVVLRESDYGYGEFDDSVAIDGFDQNYNVAKLYDKAFGDGAAKAFKQEQSRLYAKRWASRQSPAMMLAGLEN